MSLPQASLMDTIPQSRFLLPILPFSLPLPFPSPTGSSVLSIRLTPWDPVPSLRMASSLLEVTNCSLLFLKKPAPIFLVLIHAYPTPSAHIDRSCMLVLLMKRRSRVLGGAGRGYKQGRGTEPGVRGHSKKKARTPKVS